MMYFVAATFMIGLVIWCGYDRSKGMTENLTPTEWLTEMTLFMGLILVASWMYFGFDNFNQDVLPTLILGILANCLLLQTMMICYKFRIFKAKKMQERIAKQDQKQEPQEREFRGLNPIVESDYSSGICQKMNSINNCS